MAFASGGSRTKDDRTGSAYAVGMADGSTVCIISDQSELRVGDCVAIERVGETNNMWREPAAYCARENQQTVAAVRKETEAAAARREAAEEELVGASTPDAVDTATRKVSLLSN